MNNEEWRPFTLVPIRRPLSLSFLSHRYIGLIKCSNHLLESLSVHGTRRHRVINWFILSIKCKRTCYFLQIHQRGGVVAAEETIAMIDWSVWHSILMIIHHGESPFDSSEWMTTSRKKTWYLQAWAIAWPDPAYLRCMYLGNKELI